MPILGFLFCFVFPVNLSVDHFVKRGRAEESIHSSVEETRRMMMFHMMGRLQQRYLQTCSFSGSETNWNGKVCRHSVKPHYPPEVGGFLQAPY